MLDMHSLKYTTTIQLKTQVIRNSSWFDLAHCLVSLTKLYIGVMDSSGIEFFYTSEPREHEAGILNLGYNVNGFMIIPPNTPRYDIIGYCDPQCTSRVSGLYSLIGGEIA